MKCYHLNKIIMSLNAALNLFIEEYPKAVTQQFAGHAVADFVRNDLPEYLEKTIGKSDRYFAHGSAGQGNWAKVPWVAIFDRLITDTAQDGYDIVYLVREDFSGIYISLNQGITTLRNVYGSDAKQALKARAGDFLARLGAVNGEDYITGPIDLKTDSTSSLGSFYEQGNIIAKFYSSDSIPEDEVLENDLKQFMNHYLVLASKDLLPSVNSIEEDDEKDLSYEDLTNLKEHKRIERNRKLAAKVKNKLGYTCKACNFNFKEKYGVLGTNYIEAHHLTPLAELKGQKIKLDPEKDFAVLCSNCHRMIHKSNFVGDINQFINNHIK